MVFDLSAVMQVSCLVCCWSSSADVWLHDDGDAKAKVAVIMEIRNQFQWRWWCTSIKAKWIKTSWVLINLITKFMNTNGYSITCCLFESFFWSTSLKVDRLKKRERIGKVILMMMMMMMMKLDDDFQTSFHLINNEQCGSLWWEWCSPQRINIVWCYTLDSIDCLSIRINGSEGKALIFMSRNITKHNCMTKSL